MDDLISRQAAIDVADAVWSVTGDKNVAKVWDQIKDLPSEQPEIIRCRECKYNDMPPTAGNAGCTLLYGMTNQNGFCSLAERREVDDHETD